MSLVRLAWLGLRRRPLSSILTVLYVGLGTALALLVLTGQAATERSFRDAAQGYDLLLAPKNGSGLQAVLSSVFYVDEPAGTLPWSAYEAALKDERVRVAVPYALGDTFRGHRVVGTTLEHFRVLTDSQRRPLGDGVAGRLFVADTFEAVLGSLVARAAGLSLGDELRVSHGVRAAGAEHEERWKVVGVLRPTGTPQDRALFIPLESFYKIKGHAEAPAGEGHGEGHEPGHEEGHEEPGHEQGAEERTGGGKRLSALGIKLAVPTLRLQAYSEWRREHPDAQPVLPADEILRLEQTVIAPLAAAFRGVTALVVLVGGLGVLVGLYNTLQGRRREIAILRALGARPGHVFLVILLEGVLLTVLGGLVGLVLGHVTLAALSPWALTEHGVRLDPGLSSFDPLLLLGLAALGILTGALPAWRGLRTPVAENLAKEI